MITDTSERGRGLLYGLATYGLWGLLPLFLILLAPASPSEIVAWRVLFSIVFCCVALTLVRGWGELRAVLRSGRTLGLFAIAALLIYGNWQLYVIASTTGRVVEASLGYFINPIATILLAVIVLHERVSRVQWLAVGISAVSVIVLAVEYGQLPWISLGLAGTFAAYGLIKHFAGASVSAIAGLTVETAVLTPVAIAVLTVLQVTGVGVTIGTAGAGHAALLALLGPVTAVPLLLFAAAVRRIPLAWVGFLQYLAPVLQFLVAVVVLHEQMSAGRWICFCGIWVSMALIVADSLATERRLRLRR